MGIWGHKQLNLETKNNSNGVIHGIEQLSPTLYLSYVSTLEKDFVVERLVGFNYGWKVHQLIQNDHLVSFSS